MNRTTPSKLQRGLTLLEVLIAALLIAGLATVAAISLNRSNLALHESSSISDAQTIANNEIEKIRRTILENNSLCAAAPDPTETPETDDWTIGGVQYTPTIELEYVYEDPTHRVTGVDCGEARAVTVHAHVSWTPPSGNDTLATLVTTTISLLDLQAPSAIAFTPTSVRLAQGQYIELEWNEGDTRPIPEYTVTVPSDAPSGAPDNGLSASWNGIPEWRGNPASKTIAVAGDYGFDLTHTVDRERQNEARILALRNGTHTITARNVVGTSTANIAANVVQEPTGSFEIDEAVRYGAAPTVRIKLDNTGFDAEDLRIMATGPNSFERETFVGEADLGTWFPFTPQGPEIPDVFPATYIGAVKNLYTDVWGHSPLNRSEVEVNCFAPQIDVSGSTFVEEAWEGEPYSMYLRVITNNVPDLVVTATRDGDAVNPVSPVPSEPGEAPIEIRYEVTGKSAGRPESWKFEVRSESMCTEVREVFEVEVSVRITPPIDPDDNLAVASCSVSIDSVHDSIRSVTVSHEGSAAAGSFAWPYARGGVAHFTGNYLIQPVEGAHLYGGPEAGKHMTFVTTLTQEFEYFGHDLKYHTGWFITCVEFTNFTAPESWADEEEAGEEGEEGEEGDGTDPGEDGTYPGDGTETDPVDEFCELIYDPLICPEP